MNGEKLMTEYFRGSEWRKWDLQVQTILDDQYIPLRDYYIHLRDEDSEKWNRYISIVGGEDNALKFDSKEYFNDSSIIESDRCLNYVKNLFSFLSVYGENIGLIGLTDHNYYHNSLIDEFYNYSIKLGIKVICGVEINASGVHMLVYFDTIPYEKRSMSEGIKTFLSKIEVNNPKNGGVLTVSSKSVIDIMKEVHQQKGLYIFPHCNSNNGLFQERGRTDRTHLSDIFNFKPYILLQSNTKNSAKRTLEYIKSNPEMFKSMPVFTISNDSRCLKDIGTCDSNNNYTWIKADSTFEGLCQIIFEGNERVRIQEENPTKDYEKPFFSEIEIKPTNIFNGSNVKFSETKLILNPDFVTIIGGRGTGKSLLLDAIAKTFDKTVKNDRAKDVLIENDNFIVTYQKSDGEEVQYYIQDENNLDYLHIHQGEVKEIVDPKYPGRLDEEIKKLLNLPREEDTSGLTEPEVERFISEIFEIQDWFNFNDTENNRSNSLEFNIKKKKEKTDLIETVTTEKNRQLINKYTENLEEINKQRELIRSSEQLLDELNLFQRRKNEEIKRLNEQINTIERKIPLLDFQAQITRIESVLMQLHEQINELRQKNDEIDTTFKDAGIKNDVTTILEQIENYQNDIYAYDSKIEKINYRKREVNTKFTELKNMVSLIVEIHKKHIQEIDEKWIQLKKGKENWNSEQIELITELLDDIEIRGIEVFDLDNFYHQISTCLNLSKFRETQMQTRRERLEEAFNIKKQEDFLKLLMGEKIVNIDGNFQNLVEILNSDLFSKDGKRDFLRILLLERNRRNYWKVLSKSTYKGKEIRQLSVGMRGTFYVCLKLATDPFIKPFVFDQPEDDLDNEFIMGSLVPIFKKIKKYRQVIIITHNANLVVNADAEQVIVAKNEEETLSYKSGAIENPSIRKQICNILEGGETAFMMREKKYGFVNV
jgi:ABC-type dipeptide/oligopeptide/nickel transport system ATPase component